MLQKSRQYYFVFIGIVLLAQACATVEKPSGGPADRKAPSLNMANPGDSSIHFSGNKIILEFDEFVKLNNPSSQVIVNPFPKNKPEVTVQGKKIKVELKDTLIPNTTYHIFFGSAIQDITEGNPAAGLDYVFSTGGHLDSCSVEGFAGDAFTNLFSDKAWVLLYRDIRNFRDTLPVYIAHTNDKGYFTFRNVAPGNYFICALEDNNSNFKFDVPDEKIAFRSNPIELSASTTKADSLYLYLFTEAATTQKHLKTDITHYQTVRSAYRLPLQNPEIIFPSAKSNVLWNWSSKKDSVTFWIQGKDIDSLKYIIKDGAFCDTIAQALKVKTRLKNFSTDTTFRLSTNTRGERLLYNQEFILTSLMPIENIDPSKVIFRKNDDTLPTVWVKTDSLGLRWKLQVDLKAGDDCALLMNKEAVTNCFGHRSDSTGWKFKVAGSDELGSLNILFNNRPEGSLVLSADGKDMQRRMVLGNDSNQTTIIDLVPGDYVLKIILDSNGDGEWTPGKFDAGIQPEKVYTLPRAIQVKKGWASKVGWDLKQ